MCCLIFLHPDDASSSLYSKEKRNEETDDADARHVAGIHHGCRSVRAGYAQEGREEGHHQEEEEQEEGKRAQEGRRLLSRSSASCWEAARRHRCAAAPVPPTEFPPPKT